MSLRLPASLHERFKKVAEAEHRTVSQEIRRLITEHVEGTEEAA